MSHNNCETNPCQLCKRRQRGETCGSCYAGLLLTERELGHFEIERCDVCALFETDEDAADAARMLLQLLHKVYKRGLRLGSFTVSDAAEVLRVDVLNAPMLRRRAAVIINSNHDPRHTGEDSHQQLIDLARDVVKGAAS